jgi:hypothetical protein
MGHGGLWGVSATHGVSGFPTSGAMMLRQIWGTRHTSGAKARLFFDNLRHD